MKSWIHTVRAAFITLSPFALAMTTFTLSWSDRISAFLLIVYCGLVLFQPQTGKRLISAIRIPVLLPFIGIYLLLMLSLMWTENLESGFYHIEKKASLIALSLCMMMDKGMNVRAIKGSVGFFILGCVSALFYCIAIGLMNYIEFGDAGYFFYHDLGASLDFNAIYFALYLLMAIILLFHPVTDNWHNYKLVKWTTLTILAAGLILLSSRLMIALLILFMISLALSRLLKSGKRTWAFLLPLGSVILIGSTLLFLKAPKDRFRDLLSTNLSVLESDTFQYDTRFNGISIRLLLIKFGTEILSETERFFVGVGIGDTHLELDKIKEKYNLYMGNEEIGDLGYTHYNFHNQFVEIWVQAGVIAFFVFLLIFVFSLRTLDSDLCNLAILFTFFAFAATESYLERQKGIVFFVYIILALYRLNRYEFTPDSD